MLVLGVSTMQVRFVWVTTCHDLPGGPEFEVRTECIAYQGERKLGSSCVTSSSAGSVLRRFLERVKDGDSKYDPAALARRIVQVQRDMAKDVLMRKIRGPG